jgi:hypothetical protein
LTILSEMAWFKKLGGTKEQRLQIRVFGLVVSSRNCRGLSFI